MLQSKKLSRSSTISRIGFAMCGLFLIAIASYWSLSASAGAKAKDAVGNFVLADYLKPDGTFDLARGFNGSLDPKGFRLKYAKNGAPRFVPAPLPATLAPGDELWDSQFSSNGLGGPDNLAEALAVIGTDVYVGGFFTSAGSIQVSNIAKWNGSSWSSLGSGIVSDPVTLGVTALAVSGSDLYVGGELNKAGGVSVSNIAKWNGSSWSALGSGVGGSVYALAVSGNDLYVGGNFSSAGGIPAKNIAKWNGSSWSALGSGADWWVHSLAASGSDLYVGGRFSTAGGISVNRIAKWNGSSWSALSSGVNGVNDVNNLYEVDALAVNGSDLYIGGNFDQVGGVSAHKIAKWNGSSWSALGSGLVGSGSPGGGDYSPAYVNALTVSGNDLYVGGNFISAGGTPASNIAKWNGSNWSALGSGVNSVVYALAREGTKIYAAGAFTTAGLKASPHIGLYTKPPIVVNSLADGAPTNNGQCTLREALINTTNNNQSGSTDCAVGSGRITFSVTGTINLTGALPDIAGSLTIAGPGANQLTVRRDTGGDYRIFTINGGTVSISGLTVTNGKAADGGGIQSNGAVLTLADCIVTGNTATGFSGGVDISGGAVTINRSTISGNSAGAGGGGGGAYFGAALTVTNSTISSNTAVGQGGGLELEGATTTLTNCTFSGNVSNGAGNAINHYVGGSDGRVLTLTNCTITGNSSANGGGAIRAAADAGAVNSEVQLRNTLVAANLGATFVKDAVAATKFTSLGNNLTSDNGSGFLTGPGDQINKDARLSPLGNYGGTTQTHLLLCGSPAINAGSNTGAPTTDQRGFARPVGTTDIGAVEGDYSLNLSATALPNGRVGAMYPTQTLSTTGGTAPYVFTAVTPLPGGMTLGTNGAIAGTPTTAVSNFNFTVMAVDAAGKQGCRDYLLTIATCPAITLGPATLPIGRLGRPYSVQLTQTGATGGGTGITWSTNQANLPGNMTLNPSTGILAGTPSTMGSHFFTVTATDAFGCTGTKAYSLLVTKDILVTSLADGAPANDGQCTLREALLNANNNNQSGSTDCATGGGADTISFLGGAAIINLTGALPDITDDLTITGPGAKALTVRRDTGGDYRIFNIGGGQTVNISGLTVINGKSDNGGGIANSGTLSLNGCVVSGNMGGGISNGGTLTINNLTISDNTGGAASGIYNAFGPVTVTNSTLKGNGIKSQDAQVTMTNCTVSDSGSILNLAGFGSPTLTMTNCTVSNTSLRNEKGGAGVAANFVLKNTILSGSPLQNVPSGFTSLGNNLASDNGSGFLTAPGDQINKDPKLGPLANNGGPTQTYALLPGSPAIDAGTATGAPATDQRGIPRPQDGDGNGTAVVDIGAYELSVRYVNVATGNDSNSGLSAALAFKTIAKAIMAANDGAILNLAAGTYPENNLVIDKSLNFQGAGAGQTIIDGKQLDRVFSITRSGLEVNFSRLTIKGGKAPASGDDFDGGGILSLSDLTLTDCAIVNNEAREAGGGVYLYKANGTFTGCTFSGNKAGLGGGGIVLLTDTANTLQLINSTVSGNTANTQGAGGGILNFGSGTLEVIHSTIANNTGAAGGGIYTLTDPTVSAATTRLRNSILANASTNLQKGMVNNGVITNGGPAIFTSLGNNLASDNGGGFLIGSGDQINKDPKLGPLANNGGTTQTHLLQCGSPAINAGSNTGSPTTDQRGVARPQGGTVDIGAVEGDYSLTIMQALLPVGKVGQTYNAEIYFTLATTPLPVTFTAVTPLPAGLSLELNAFGYAVIKGTPTAAVSNFGFTLSGVSQSFPGTQQGCFNYTITIDPACPAINITPATLPAGQLGQQYNQQLTQTGGVGNIAYSIVAGVTPNGVLLSPTGVLSGQPTSAGTFNFTVRAIDGNLCTGERAYTVQINNPVCPAISITPASLPPATQNQNYNQLLTGAGGTGPYTFTQVFPLPAGLTLTTAGLISGSPTISATGGFSFRVRARDVNNCEGAQDFTLVINQACPTITINPASPLPNATLALPYSQQLTQTGGIGTVSWSISAGSLTNGLSLNPATGLISGTPTSFGIDFFTVKVTDANGCTGTKSYQLGVNACATISISPASPPDGTVGIQYNLTLSSSGGTAPYTYDLFNNTQLPPGLALSGGSISGIPTTPGSFNFTIQSNSSLNNCFVQQNFTITINPAITSNGLQFYPLAKPLRLLDTRPANQRPGPAFDTPGVKIAGLLSGGVDRVEPAQVTFDGLTIPANAKAVVGTATVINFPSPGAYDGTGNVTFYPSDANRPEVSNLNYAANQTVSNGFTVALSNTGAFSIFSYSDVHLVVEIVGYYAAPAAAGLYFHPLPKPIRLLETRPQTFYTGCDTPRAPLTAGNVRTEQGRLTCGGVTIPAAAQALVGNLTAVNAAANGLATAYAGDQASTPIATSLAYVTTQPIANAFVTRLGSDGTFKLAVSQTTDFLVDISGYYSTEATDVNGQGLLFTQLAHPIRLLETRAGFPGCYMTSAPLAAQSNRVQPAWGGCDGVTIPASARAIIGNVTAVTTTPTTQISFGSGNVTLYPSAANQPDVSNLNYTVNQNIPNAFTVRLNTTDGKFTIFVFDQIDLLIDVSGYFAP